MKRIISFVLIYLFILTPMVNIFAISSQNDEFEIVTVTSDSEKVKPDAVVTMTKTIVKEYTNLSDIPSSIYYEEYSSCIWWSGTLYYVPPIRYYPASGTYRVTFRGTLYGNT